MPNRYIRARLWSVNADLGEVVFKLEPEFRVSDYPTQDREPPTYQYS